MKKLLFVVYFCNLASVFGQIFLNLNDPNDDGFSPPEGEKIELSNGLKALHLHSPTMAGQPIVWTTHFTNSSNVAITFEFGMGATIWGYNGKSRAKILNFDSTNHLAAAGFTNIVTSVPPTSYLPWATGLGGFCLRYGFAIESDGEKWVCSRQSVIDIVDVFLTLAPATPTLQLEKTVKATVNYINPLPVPMHNARVKISGTWGFSTDEDEIWEDGEWELGTIQPNAIIHVEKILTAKKVSDDAYIVAIISSDELKGLRQTIYIKVVE